MKRTHDVKTKPSHVFLRMYEIPHFYRPWPGLSVSMQGMHLLAKNVRREASENGQHMALRRFSQTARENKNLVTEEVDIWQNLGIQVDIQARTLF